MCLGLFCPFELSYARLIEMFNSWAWVFVSTRSAVGSVTHLSFLKNTTDRPTKRRIWGIKGKLHFQLYNKTLCEKEQYHILAKKYEYIFHIIIFFQFCFAWINDTINDIQIYCYSIINPDESVYILLCLLFICTTA